MHIRKANTIDDIYGAVWEKPLALDELQQFYCDTAQARGNKSVRFRLKKRIEASTSNGSNPHLLFVGYRGSGKSTELNHLEKDIQNEYAVLNYSVANELDAQSINYIELFIVTMERLFDFAAEKELPIEDAFLDKIVAWTQTKEIKEISDRHFSAEVETGVETSLGIPFLKHFFLKLKGAAKASKSFKETIKQTLEPRLSDLIMHCNDLISEVRIKLPGVGLKDIVIIIDDLDKVPYDRAQSLFFNYANQLTQLAATVIYTFPVMLYYHSNFNAIKNYFSDVINLPMIMISEKDGTDSAVGIDAMRQIIITRINESLFAPGILDKFVRISGGVIRDMFALLIDAADSASFRESALIEEVDYRTAFYELKNEYNNNIADDTDEKGNVKHTVDDFYKAMADLANDPDKRHKNSETLLLLRRTLCVLSYNGEGWCDVHPVMKEVLRDRGYLA